MRGDSTSKYKLIWVCRKQLFGVFPQAIPNCWCVSVYVLRYIIYIVITHGLDIQHHHWSQWFHHLVIYLSPGDNPFKEEKGDLTWRTDTSKSPIPILLLEPLFLPIHRLGRMSRHIILCRRLKVNLQSTILSRCLFLLVSVFVPLSFPFNCLEVKMRLSLFIDLLLEEDYYNLFVDCRGGRIFPGRKDRCNKCKMLLLSPICPYHMSFFESPSIATTSFLPISWKSGVFVRQSRSDEHSRYRLSLEIEKSKSATVTFTKMLHFYQSYPLL